MSNNESHPPHSVPQVMVSSTFLDLEEHRAAVIDAIRKHGMHANVMENSGANPKQDVIDTSLKMVRDSAAYVLVIGFKYGQTPKCKDRNPNQLSITELEFEEAQRLGRPTLLFVMGDDHLMKPSAIEQVAKSKKKLDEFRKRAKKWAPESAVNRVYGTFNSLEEFKDQIAAPLSALREHLKPEADPIPETPIEPVKVDPDFIPTPPAFYAEPDYIGSHKFVGRDSQLQELSDWARPADPTNLLLFEAIGGNGKSMLTWEWTTKHATQVRDDWAGRFWYSFYERGAIMADFCQRALAYMTGQPLKELRKKKTAELREPLLKQLHEKPWLLILDGLERVLVAYHRIDAAEMPDEEANDPTDKIVNRNPCDAIRDEDNDLLRALAAAKPSKILVSSRLTPRLLLNPSSQPIPGAKRIALPGLRPADAEKLLRSCGIEGDTSAIQKYLTENCDNHPLVIGILGGLITNYLPARGNFDAWAADPEGGAKLDLGSLDLIQRRNHILRAALDSLPPESLQLLSTLALISESVDYETLSAFNPHDPRDTIRLAETVTDLEHRGLLQYDGRTQRHDLHPVVRGVAAGSINAEDKERYGQRVVDYFNSIPHDPYEQAVTLEDLRPGLNVVGTLLKLGHFQQAEDAFAGDLMHALLFNIEAYAESLSLIRPFFLNGWGELPACVNDSDAAYLANNASVALHFCGEFRDALISQVAALRSDLERQDWWSTTTDVQNISRTLACQILLAKSIRINQLALDLAALNDDQEAMFIGRLFQFCDQAILGRWVKAEFTWELLNSMGRDWSRAVYRPGSAEEHFAQFHAWRGSLQEEQLSNAEQLATAGKSRRSIRNLHALRGAWRLDHGEWALAAESFAEAVRMARESGIPATKSETGLALAKYRVGKQQGSQREAVRLAEQRQPAHRYLAMLWLELNEFEQAKKHALAAYKWAWADGEPYVHRYELTKTTELLEQMGVPIPDLPPYDPAKDEPFPWEADVRAAIEKLKAEKEAREREQSESEEGD